MRIVRLLTIGLLVATVVAAVVTGREFLLAALNVLLFAVLQAISAMLPRKPHLFNFPEKERFLALPAEHRAPVIEEMRFFLACTALAMAITFALVQLLAWRTAMGHPPGVFAILPFFAFLLTPGLLLLVSRVNEATERAEQRWRAAEGGSARTGGAPIAPGTGFTHS